MTFDFKENKIINMKYADNCSIRSNILLFELKMIVLFNQIKLTELKIKDCNI